ncbi:MAG: DUF177 domain-containing protein [Lachnospiraceae bacterium]|nr:DUF177 domain-containing protein [Lachnospiraceae bacterium]
MLIHLSEVLSAEGKKCSYTVPVGFGTFRYHGNECPVLERPDASLVLVNKGDQKVELQLSASVKLGLPCDRCLEETAAAVEIDLCTDIDMKETVHDTELSEEEMEAEQERLENQTFVEGHTLDTDKLLMQELILRIPAKILCKEDCKGICYQCGKNLNYGACDCKDEPKDPRMAAILDIFKAATEE